MCTNKPISTPFCAFLTCWLWCSCRIFFVLHYTPLVFSVGSQNVCLCSVSCSTLCPFIVTLQIHVECTRMIPSYLFRLYTVYTHLSDVHAHLRLWVDVFRATVACVSPHIRVQYHPIAHHNSSYVYMYAPTRTHVLYCTLDLLNYGGGSRLQRCRYQQCCRHQ